MSFPGVESMRARIAQFEREGACEQKAVTHTRTASGTKDSLALALENAARVRENAEKEAAL